MVFKRLSLLLLLLSAVLPMHPASAQCVTSEQARELMPPRTDAFYRLSSREQEVLLAHEEALFWFMDAKCAVLKPSTASNIARVALVLADVVFKLVPYQSAQLGCEPTTVAYVDPNKSFRRIHICPLAFTTGPKGLAQIIVHEAFHSFGILNECDAHHGEVAILALAGIRRLPELGYGDQCGDR
jgi:hypothetical protein